MLVWGFGSGCVVVSVRSFVRGCLCMYVFVCVCLGLGVSVSVFLRVCFVCACFHVCHSVFFFVFVSMCVLYWLVFRVSVFVGVCVVVRV